MYTLASESEADRQRQTETKRQTNQSGPNTRPTGERHSSTKGEHDQSWTV